VYSAGPGYGHIVGCCENGNEASNFIKCGELFDRQSDYEFL
jgi:hypothetical protein